MARCSDFPQPDPNRRVDPCGCQLAYCFLPGEGDRWVYLRRCDEHKKAS